MPNRLGNPGIFGLSTFAFALSVLGFQLVVNEDVAGATLYAVLVAALGETLAGMWSIARGEAYLAGVLTTFGLWLVGYYFFHFSELFTPQASGLFLLMLLVPVAIMAIPAFRLRRVALSAAFVALLVMLASVGMGAYHEVSSLETLGGVFAFVAAAVLYFLVYEEVTEATQAATEPDPRVVAAGH